MIKANFSAYNRYATDSLYQWDIDRVLSVTGLNLSVAPEVHFSNANMDKAIVRQGTLVDHVVSAIIPNSLLQSPLTILAHIGVYEGSTFKVLEVIEIPVIPRKRPSDYVIEDTDEEIYSFKALENAIANMTTKSETNAISARIDNIIAHNNDTDGNTELLDIRYGADGKTYNSAGEAVRGQFENVQVLPQYADFWYLGSDFYFESGENFVAYINFESLTRRVSTVSDRHTWDMIKADINDDSRFVTTPKGRGDCLKLDYFDFLGFNPKTNSFFVDKRPYTVQTEYVVIAFNAWGRLENCLLSNMIGGFYVEDLPKINENAEQIEKNTTNILENSRRLAVLETGGDIPEYWTQSLDSKIKRIKENQSVGGAKTTSFAFITDVHNGEGMSIACDLLSRINNECDIKHVFNGGDMVSGAGKCTKEHIIEELKNVKNSFSKIENMIFLEGNHDSAYDETTNDGYYLQNLTLGESYNYIHRVNKKGDITLGVDGTYGFVDDKLSKIRYICLNTSDLLYKTEGDIMANGYNKMKSGALRQAQLDFIAEALNAPEDYSVIIMSHIPLYREGVNGADMTVYNSDILLNMLNAVKNKSTFSAVSLDSVPTDYKAEVNYDFSNVNVHVIGCIAGHTHYDNLVVANGINHITTLNNSMNVWDDSPNKVSGTTSECAFDIFTINTETKSVKITRVGAGNDREFTY